MSCVYMHRCERVSVAHFCSSGQEQPISPTDFQTFFLCCAPPLPRDDTASVTGLSTIRSIRLLTYCQPLSIDSIDYVYTCHVYIERDRYTYIYTNIYTHAVDSIDSITYSIRWIFDLYKKLDSPGSQLPAALLSLLPAALPAICCLHKRHRQPLSPTLRDRLGSPNQAKQLQTNQ